MIRQNEVKSDLRFFTNEMYSALKRLSGAAPQESVEGESERTRHRVGIDSHDIQDSAHSVCTSYEDSAHTCVSPHFVRGSCGSEALHY